MTIERERATQLGIPVSTIASSLQALLGGVSQTTYVDRGEEYDVYLRANQTQFNGISDISRIYLKAASGEMVSLSTLATVTQVASPQRLNHYQRQKAVTLTADVAPGHTLGEALDFLDGWAADHPAHRHVGGIMPASPRTIATTRGDGTGVRPGPAGGLSGAGGPVREPC